MNYRPERVANLIREELSKLIERELEFPEMLVTLTEVVIDKKLEGAKTGVSVFPSEKTDEALEILHAAQSELQYKLLRIINIKPMPKIHFYADYGPENAAKVEKKLLDEEALGK